MLDYITNTYTDFLFYIFSVPRHARQCNVLAWNPSEPNILAAGLDKYRADHSVLLWDINKCCGSGEYNGTGRYIPNSNNSHHNVQAAVELPKPVAEFGVSETTNSMAWFRSQSKIIALGLNQKNIKIIDFRGRMICIFYYFHYLLLFYFRSQ